MTTCWHIKAYNSAAWVKRKKGQFPDASISFLYYISDKWNTSKLVWRYMTHALESILDKIGSSATTATFGYVGACNSAAWVSHVSGQLPTASISFLYYISGKWNTSKLVWRYITHALESILAKVGISVTAATFLNVEAYNSVAWVRRVQEEFPTASISFLYYINGKWNTSKLVWRYITHALESILVKIRSSATMVTLQMM